jgi:hypothetical protein
LLAIGFLLYYGLQPPGQLPPRQHHPVPAAFALKADICAEPHNGPLKGPAWVGFAQTQKVIEFEVREHENILTR